MDVELKAKKSIHKRYDYSESIQNGISLKRNLAFDYGINNNIAPTIILKKLYIEKYTVPLQLQINTTTQIVREIKDVPNFGIE